MSKLNSYRGHVTLPDPTTGNSQDVVTQRQLPMCGMCDRSMHMHPFFDEYAVDGSLLSVACNRSMDDFGDYLGANSSDYYKYGPPGDFRYFSLVSNSDLFTSFTEPDPEDAYVRDPLVDGYDSQDFYWTDSSPDECTSILTDNPFNDPTLAPKGMTVNTTAYSARNRNAYVEGVDGFHTETIWDEGITRKFHAKLLNVYREKGTGTLRVGGLQILHSVNELNLPVVTARCVHRDCRVKDAAGNYVQRTFSITLSDELTREQMEDFVYSIIRHGNNHSAQWFHTRTIEFAGSLVETYYKVHDFSCNLERCDSTTHYCQSQITAQAS